MSGAGIRGDIVVESTAALRLAIIERWWVPVGLGALQGIIVVSRSLTERGDFDRQLDLHYAGTDIASVSAALTPNVVLAALWAFLSVWALFVCLRYLSAAMLPALALTLCFMGSPWAWDAFRAGSPYAFTALAGIGLLVVTRGALTGTIHWLWPLLAASGAVLVNPTNLIGVLAMLAYAALAVFPGVSPRPDKAIDRRFDPRPLAVVATLAAGTVVGFALVGLIFGPVAAEYRAIAVPLTLGDVANQIRVVLPGAITGMTPTLGASPTYPLPSVLVVPLWWICAAGVIAGSTLMFTDRRWNGLTSSLVVISVIGGPMTAFLVSRVAGAHFGYSGLAAGAVIPMFLVAASLIARNKVLNIAVVAIGAALVLSLLVWSVLPA